MTVYIANISGVNLTALAEMEQTLVTIGVNPRDMLRLDQSQLEGTLGRVTRNILVIPGGRTSLQAEVFENTNVLQNAVIKNGWNALMSCAAANIVCKDLITRNGSSIKPPFGIKLPTLLTDVTASAPSHPITAPGDPSNGRIVQVYPTDSPPFGCYWYEGSYFTLDTPSESTVVATYDNTPGKIAGVARQCGLGKVVALGPHPEIEHTYVGVTQETPKNKTDRLRFFKNQMAFLGAI
jgi:glutamine amidotransferase-like uncharacterized protein